MKSLKFRVLIPKGFPYLSVRGQSALFKNNNITFRILLITISISSAFTLIATGVQVYAGFARDRQSIDDTYDKIRKTYSESIATSLFNLNESLLKTQLKGLISAENIVFVRVKENLYGSKEEIQFDAGTTPTGGRIVKRDMPLTYSVNSREKITLGTMTVYATLDNIYARTMDNLVVILLTNLIKTFIACLAIFYAIYRVVTRHITHISKYTGRISTDNLDHRLVLDKKNVGDELDILTESFNHLTSSLKSNIEDLRTARQKLEDKVVDQTYELKESNIRLRQSNLELSDKINKIQAMQGQMMEQERLVSMGILTAGIAHEIKNPLNLVVNSERLLRRFLKKVGKNDLTDEKRAEYFEKMESLAKSSEEQSMRINKIVTTMLMFARSGEGEMLDTDLRIIIEDTTLFALKSASLRTRIAFEKNLELATLPRIPINQQLLGRCVINLIDNACYAMAEKAKTAKNYTPSLHIVLRSENQDVIIEIFDNGPGIPEEIRDRVTEPFFTTKSAGDGTGLGLSITDDSIKRHNGRLEFESSEAGTCARITLMDALNGVQKAAG